MYKKSKLIHQTEEERIIAGCLARDRTCQAQLYEFYSPKMIIVCYRYAKNKEEAEEILQDGFILVFRCISQFKNEGSFEGWIKRIMINCSLRWYRNQLHLHPVVSLEGSDIDKAGGEEIIMSLAAKELLGLVQRLPAACRIVFNLFVIEGMKHREIAALLNISEGTCKSNLSDAREILKKSIHHIYKIAK